MASKKIKTEATPAAVDQPEQAQELLSIDVLREKHKIKRSIFAGVCAANDWKPGRAMTEKAFLQAVANFTGAPIGAPQGK